MTTEADNASPAPWATQADAAACDRAFQELATGLPGQFSLDGRVHVPTLLSGVGAFAGFCAHVSLISDSEAIAAAEAAGDIAVVQRPNGEELLVGPAMNRMLLAVDDVISSGRLWNVLAGVSTAAGVDPARLPDVDGMFARVRRALSTPDEGFPMTPEAYRPQISARETLRVAGPFAMLALTGRNSGGKAVPETSWVAVGAQTAGSVLSRTASAIPLEIGAQIVMEAAISVSQLRPKLSA